MSHQLLQMLLQPLALPLQRLERRAAAEQRPSLPEQAFHRLQRQLHLQQLAGGCSRLGKARTRASLTAMIAMARAMVRPLMRATMMGAPALVAARSCLQGNGGGRVMVMVVTLAAPGAAGKGKWGTGDTGGAAAAAAQRWSHKALEPQLMRARSAAPRLLQRLQRSRLLRARLSTTRWMGQGTRMTMTHRLPPCMPLLRGRLGIEMLLEQELVLVHLSAQAQPSLVASEEARMALALALALRMMRRGCVRTRAMQCSIMMTGTMTMTWASQIMTQRMRCLLCLAAPARAVLCRLQAGARTGRDAHAAQLLLLPPSACRGCRAPLERTARPAAPDLQRAALLHRPRQQQPQLTSCGCSRSARG